MDDCDSAPAPCVLDIDPTRVTPAPERVVHKCNEYLRRPRSPQYRDALSDLEC
jgi:hypothetical protein